MKQKIFNGEAYLRAVFDAIPSPVLLVGRDLRIHDFNRAAREFLGGEAGLHEKRLCGDLLRCVHASESERGCGTTEYCDDCVVRNSVGVVLDGSEVFRRIAEMKLNRNGFNKEIWFLVTGAAFQYQGNELAILTLEEVSELVTLRRIIPLCLHCRKLRDDGDYWRGVEEYFERYTGTRFSHGICPECMKEHYPDLGDDPPEDREP